MRIIAAVLMMSLLASCGGGGGGGTGGGGDTGGGGGTLPLTGGEGSPTSPVPVALNTPRSSTVGAFDDSYYSFATTTAGTYVVSLLNPSVDVEWTLYSNADFTGSVASCDNYWSASTEQCTANLQAGRTYYLQVTEWMSFDAGTFTLAISQITSEGSTLSPVDLTIGATHSGSVAQSGVSYYRFRTTNAVAHTVTIGNSVPNWYSVTSKVYDTGFAGTLLATCGPTNNPSCTVNGLSANTYYYVEVLGNSSTAVRYDVTVTEGVSEGSVANPIELVVSAASHTGAVDASSSSYYKFTTTTTAGEYVLSLTGTTAPSIYVYSGSDFATGSLGSCTPNTPCKLYGLDAQSIYYVRVRNFTTSAVPSYQISVAQGATEGSVNDPVALTVDAAAHNAAIDSSVAVLGSAFYSFQTTTVSGSYTISLSGTQKNLGWTLYNDAAFSYSVASCNNVTTTGPGDETCPTTNLDSSTTYYLKVMNNEYSSSSSYGVAVATGGGSEGSKNDPLLLTGPTHTGAAIKYGYSYYSFTTGGTAMTFIIGLANMQTDLNWTLYSDSAFTNQVVYCNAHYDTTAEVCSTEDSYISPVLSANTTYYLKVSNYNNAASTYALTLTPLDPAAGCSGSAVECFNFENNVYPASFTQTSQSNGQQWKWSTDTVSSAGSGTVSIKNGPTNYPYSSCFDYTPAAKPGSVSFSLRTDASNALNAYIIIDGGSTLSLGSWGGTTPWRRVSYDTTIYNGTVFKFQWCYQRNVNYTSGAETVWVDDIEFR